MKTALLKKLSLFKIKSPKRPVDFLLPATRIDFRSFSELKPAAKPVIEEVEAEAGSSEMQTLFRLLDNGVI